MEYWQRDKKCLPYIKLYGCLISSMFKQMNKLIEFPVKLNLNDVYRVIKEHKGFNDNGEIIWERLKSIFPAFKIRTFLYSSRHGHFNLNNIMKTSIITVDGSKKTGYQSHWLAVEDIEKDTIKAYDPYYNDIVNIENRYNINREKELKKMIYSIVNIERA